MSGFPLFKRCAYCSLIRLCRKYGWRGWVCDSCVKDWGRGG